MKVLVLEPDVVLARTYESALQNVGHVVEIAHNAQAAIYHLERYTPELITIELQMANHNGIEFLYELRSYPEWQRIPVIVLSFVPRRQMQVRLTNTQLGIQDFLYKPSTTLEQLVRAVGRSQSVFA